MAADATPRMTLIASREELPPDARVWGTGGWIPPEDREALDWLMLAHLLGWKVKIAYAEDEPRGSDFAGSHVAVVACDPDSLHPAWADYIRSLLRNTPVLVVARAAAPGREWAEFAGVVRVGTADLGGRLTWKGPGDLREWRVDVSPAVTTIADADSEVWADLAAQPLIRARRFGLGVLATIGFHPSAIRDAGGAGGSLVKHLLLAGAPRRAASLDLAGAVILRMDDPGASQNVFCASWCYPALDRAAWQRTGEILAAHDACLSVGYVGGWVDDGDATRGHLSVDGRNVERIPGAVHDSPKVRYEDMYGHRPGAVSDYVAQFQMLRDLQQRGLASIELHGYTHLHPDRSAWAAAADRYENVNWYRELGRQAVPVLDALPCDRRPIARGTAAIEQYFGEPPTTLICPGDDFTDLALEDALDSGIKVIGSYYLALRVGDRFCWATHICAPYLDLVDSSWFDAELPVVGYFHDRDIAIHGPDWLAKNLDAWVRRGACRFIDYRQLAGLLQAGAS